MAAASFRVDKRSSEALINKAPSEKREPRLPLLYSFLLYDILKQIVDHLRAGNRTIVEPAGRFRIFKYVAVLDGRHGFPQGVVQRGGSGVLVAVHENEVIRIQIGQLLQRDGVPVACARGGNLLDDFRRLQAEILVEHRSARQLVADDVEFALDEPDGGNGFARNRSFKLRLGVCSLLLVVVQHLLGFVALVKNLADLQQRLAPVVVHFVAEHEGRGDLGVLVVLAAFDGAVGADDEQIGIEAGHRFKRKIVRNGREILQRILQVLLGAVGDRPLGYRLHAERHQVVFQVGSDDALRIGRHFDLVAEPVRHFGLSRRGGRSRRGWRRRGVVACRRVRMIAASAGCEQHGHECDAEQQRRNFQFAFYHGISSLMMEPMPPPLPACPIRHS
ncbi:hypothetical protein BN871_CA_00010 [Paenibacillus sp. P22]|nr:hypothetical protein BN871_CA_00010 [Paenibacillus sp. P22]